MDALTFASHVLPTDPTAPLPDGVYLSGLFLDGASWDPTRAVALGAGLSHGAFQEATDPAALHPALPVVWLQPVQIAQVYSLPNMYYLCPLYKTALRRGQLTTLGLSSNFIIVIDLPTDKQSKHWSKRGTALLTQLDEM
jgi:dynein heavy chain